MSSFLFSAFSAAGSIGGRFVPVTKASAFLWWSPWMTAFSTYSTLPRVPFELSWAMSWAMSVCAILK